MYDPGILKEFNSRTGNKLKLLISYAYLGPNFVELMTACKEMLDEWVLDSGAYSAERGRAVITVQEYGNYIAMFGHLFEAYFNLDDRFDDAEHNLRNQIYLEKRLASGLKRPVPVIHDKHDPCEEISMYVDMGHEYIAIGSDKSDVDKIMEYVNDKHPGLQIHMFGSLDRKMLFKWRPYSADSAAWAHMAGFGLVNYWCHAEQREYTVSFARMIKAEKQESESVISAKKFVKTHPEFKEFLRQTFGFDLAQLAGAHPLPRQIVNLYFFTQLEALLNAPAK